MLVRIDDDGEGGIDVVAPGVSDQPPDSCSDVLTNRIVVHLGMGSNRMPGTGLYDGRCSIGLFSTCMTHSPFGPVRCDAGDGCHCLQQG